MFDRQVQLKTLKNVFLKLEHCDIGVINTEVYLQELVEGKGNEEEREDMYLRNAIKIF